MSPGDAVAVFLGAAVQEAKRRHGLPPEPAPDMALTMCIHAAARIYAARIERRGACEPRDLVDHGFNSDFVQQNFPEIKAAGERLHEARRQKERL